MKLSKYRIDQMHRAAQHMTLNSFVKAYGRNNKHVWINIDKNINYRDQNPNIWPFDSREV